jgi:molecular chaperone DnaK
LTLERHTVAKHIIGVDFGNNTTKLVINTGNGGSLPVPAVLPGISRVVPQDDGTLASLIPSIIHYADDGSVLIGMEVIKAGLLTSHETVRWMPHYISLGSPARLKIRDRILSYQQAAADFLSAVIRSTAKLYQINGAETVLAVPAGTRDHYRSLLNTLNTGDVVLNVHQVEQPAAVASACLHDHAGGTTFMIIDFGGTTLTVSIVTGFLHDGEVGYRIIGKATRDIGGDMLNHMLLHPAGTRKSLPDPDHELPQALLLACEHAKECLSSETSAAITWMEETIQVTRQDFETVLAREGVYGMFSSTIEQGLEKAAGRGYSEHSLSSVILIGGSGSIPSFRRIVESRFGSATPVVYQPVDAVARGAATRNNRSVPSNRVGHAYAIRVWNPEKGEFELRTIIQKGCPIPSNGPVNRFRIQASYDGQSRLGIPLYRLATGSSDGRFRELRFEQTGGILMEDYGSPAFDRDSSVWINEKSLPFIPADPPAMRGEPRFEILISIDASRELLISARDIRTGKQVLENFRAGLIQ